jgi:hypothetical protein
MKTSQDRGAWTWAVHGRKVIRKIRLSLTMFVCIGFSQPGLPLSNDKNVTFFLLRVGCFISCF